MRDVTVITCTFGRPELLRRAVESVQSQVFDGTIHHVIVEDFGNEPSIIDMGLGEDIQLITATYRTGYPGFLCRSIGATVARTELIAFLDDDNWYEPNHIEELVDLQNDSGADFVWSSTRLWTSGGEIIGYRNADTPGPARIDISEVLCRRSLYIGSGGLDPRDGPPGDNLMFERWARRGARYAHSEAVTLNYTVSQDWIVKVVRGDCLRGLSGYYVGEQGRNPVGQESR